MNIVITAGGTSEPIDKVRKITNSSSGKHGSIIASKFKNDKIIKANTKNEIANNIYNLFYN